jgi:hypothetical protein
MRCTPRFAMLALLATALVAVGGCGGSSDVKQSNEYVQAVNRAQNSFATTVDQVSGRITSTSSSSEDRRTLKQFQTAVAKVVGDLRAVKPPDKVKTLHQELVNEIDAYGHEVRRAAKGISSRDAQKLLAAQQDLVKATSAVSSQINGTIDRINKRLHS